MEKTPTNRLRLVMILVVAVNVLITGYLLKTVHDQDRRIHALERNDAIKQKVDNLNSKVDGLKSRIEGFFR